MAKQRKKPKAYAGLKKVKDTRVVPDRNVVASANQHRGSAHPDRKNDYKRKPKHPSRMVEGGMMTFKQFLIESTESVSPEVSRLEQAMTRDMELFGIQDHDDIEHWADAVAPSVHNELQAVIAKFGEDKGDEIFNDLLSRIADSVASELDEDE